ncbi:MAG: hypothetical protein K2H76_01990, partial [Muribaculaceae bacterium]|nr:hypothetical protein [Muribaculaceae bacterium]
MKRILLILALLLSGISVSAQRKVLKECTLHYDIEDFPVRENGDMIKVEVVPNMYMIPFRDNDMPELPRFDYTIYEGNSHDDIEFDWEINSLEKIVFKENVDISIMHPTKLQSFSGWSKFEDFEGYNKNLIDVRKDLRFIVLWVTPFEYDPNTRTLYFIKDIDLTVRIYNKTSKRDSRKIIPHENNKNLIIRESAEPNVIKPGLDTGMDLIDDYSYPNGFDYLIVTSNALKDTYIPLLEWKKQKGLKVKLLTVEEIDKTYEGNDRQEKIKNCIAYHQRADGLTYVLLGGGSKTIPSRGCYGQVKIGEKESLTDYSIPSDLFYACTQETLNWDGNGNGIYGEADDGCDLTSYVAVTRVPLETVSETEAFISKLMEYEKFGMASGNNNILLTGAKMYWTQNGKSDAELNGNHVADMGINDKWEGGIVRKFDTSDKGYTLNSTFIANELSKGYAFMDVQSHGERANWVFPYDERFGKKNNNTPITNPGFTIVTSNACDVNAFDQSLNSSDPCLSQYLIGDPNNGVVAFYGCSRNGLGSPTIGERGYAQLFEGAFYGNLFSNPEENKSFGKIIGLSKRIFSKKASGTNFFRWLQFCMNPIGDPEMPIYVTKPKEFDSVKIIRRVGTWNTMYR